MKKLNTLDKVLIVLASFLFLFITATVIIYTYKKGIEIFHHETG